MLARGGLLAFEPKSGKIDFHFPWRAADLESVNAANPVVVGKRVFVSETYGPGAANLVDDVYEALKAKRAFVEPAVGMAAALALLVRGTEAVEEAVGAEMARALADAGFNAVSIKAAADADLLAVKGIGPATLAKLRALE